MRVSDVIVEELDRLTVPKHASLLKDYTIAAQLIRSLPVFEKAIEVAFKDSSRTPEQSNQIARKLVDEYLAGRMGGATSSHYDRLVQVAAIENNLKPNNVDYYTLLNTLKKLKNTFDIDGNLIARARK